MSNNEEIVRRESRCSHRSNHLDPFDWSGGKVLLTKDRLSFVPGSLEFTNAEHSIRLEDIVSIQAKHNDFFSNKLSLLLRNGSIEEFRVPKRKEWLETLEKALREMKRGQGENWKATSTEFSIPKKSIKWYFRFAVQVLFVALCVGVLAFVFQMFFL
jgi:hypothetical protein